MDRSSLRSNLRAQRRAIPSSQQRQRAAQVHLALANHPWFRRAQHIAFYLANDGELDPLLLLQHAWRMGKTVYLPVVQGKPPRMQFRVYQRGDRLTPNRFGIGEPPPRRRQCSAKQLDMVLMPLVGFDLEGNRLGMGGGFYDRALAPVRYWGPKRLGLAHALQQVPRLPIEPWDIPLHGIITDRAIHYF